MFADGPFALAGVAGPVARRTAGVFAGGRRFAMRRDFTVPPGDERWDRRARAGPD